MTLIRRGQVWVNLDTNERFRVERVYKHRARVRNLATSFLSLVLKHTIYLNWMKEA